MLNLDSRFTLVQNNTFYVPSFGRNFISIPLLDKLGYCVTFGNFGVNLSINSTNIGYGVLIDGLYQLYLVVNGEYILHIDKATSKRSRIQERFFMLWHKRLGHISRERVERLIKNDIFPSLDFEDMEICVDCIKGKLPRLKIMEQVVVVICWRLFILILMVLIPLLYVAMGIFSLSLMIFLVMVIFI